MPFRLQTRKRPTPAITLVRPSWDGSSPWSVHSTTASLSRGACTVVPRGLSKSPLERNSIRKSLATEAFQPSFFSHFFLGPGCLSHPSTASRHRRLVNTQILLLGTHGCSDTYRQRHLWISMSKVHVHHDRKVIASRVLQDYLVKTNACRCWLETSC